MLFQNDFISTSNKKSGSRKYAVLLFSFLSLFCFFLSCKQPYSLTELLDESLERTDDQLSPLTISPSSVVLYRGSSTTFFASGGSSPYTFSVTEGGGSINDSGVYTAPDTAGTAKIQLADSAGAAVEAEITISDTFLDVDYIVEAITNSPSSADTGALIGQSFSYYNQGSDSGGMNVFWNAYISDDETLDGSDVLIDTGITVPLQTGTSSSSITIDGNWPDSAGVYYLIVKLSSGDDTEPYNNIKASASFTVNATSLVLDYVVTNVTIKYPTVTTGSLCAETMDLHNIGGLDGSDPITWKAYASLDQVLEVGTDTFLDQGSVSSLNAGASHLSVPISVNWPAAGSYYLLVSISSDDETLIGNNSSGNGLFTVVNPPDYTISALPTVDYQLQGEAGKSFGDSGMNRFYITELNGNAGQQPISWEAFISFDTVLDGNDTSVLSGSIDALGAGATSDQILLNSAAWPSFGSNYNLIITIHSGDDSDSSNNTFVSSESIVVPELLNEEEGTYANSAGVGTFTPVRDLSAIDGGELDPYQLVHVAAKMDAASGIDSYKIVAGDTAGNLLDTLEISVVWTGGNIINFTAWDEHSNTWVSNDTNDNSEPLLPPPYKLKVTPGDTYYIGIEFISGATAGADYTLILHGK